jgi:mediator of RNA polymerase II transcription subunit 23
MPRHEIPDWINSIGLLMSTLPDAYWEGLYQRLVTTLSSPPLTNWMIAQSPFKLFNYDAAAGECRAHTRLRFLLALAHSVYHHAGFSQVQTLPDLVREKLLPVIKTEEQMLFVLHLTGPFLQRLHSERYMRPLFDLTVQYYRILLRVDKESQPQPLKYMDEICDILYHVKYETCITAILEGIVPRSQLFFPDISLRATPFGRTRNAS